ncbi:hypothetical protein [Agrobacterium tumefaciens]|nr:hypothetical protein [Agrobacterium tumefaciens]
MRMPVILVLIASIFAVPCIYDAASAEPSPFAGLYSLAMAY